MHEHDEDDRPEGWQQVAGDRSPASVGAEDQGSEAGERPSAEPADSAPLEDPPGDDDLPAPSAGDEVPGAADRPTRPVRP
jgi:hypothetical protein